MKTVIATVSLAAVSFFGFWPVTGHWHQAKHISGNFAYDIVGVQDTRHNTWGTAIHDERTLTFVAPPEGYQIRIHKITGDLTARVKSFGVQHRGANGVLAGIYTGVNNGSQYADWAADRHFLYVQDDIGPSGVATRSFDVSFDPTDSGAVLENNQLIFKVASFLNETGYDTHFELTFSQIDFCYERISP